MKLIEKTSEITVESTEFGIHGELVLENVQEFALSHNTIYNLLKITESMDWDASMYELEGTYLTGVKIDFSRPINLALAKKAVYHDEFDDATKLLILRVLLAGFIRATSIIDDLKEWNKSLKSKFHQSKNLMSVKELIKRRS